MSTNSAASTAVADPGPLMSFGDYYADWYKKNVNPDYFTDTTALDNHWSSDFENFFTGRKSAAMADYETYKNKWQNDYDAYLADINQRNEEKAVQSARAWDEYMSSTQYQRAFKDLEKAGVNPYMLVSGSGVGGASYTSSAKAETMKRKASSTSAKDNNVKNTKGRDFALILLGIARLVAAL